MPQYINRTLQPPDTLFDNSLEETEKALEWVCKNYTADQLFDLEEHDKKVSFPFAEYLSYHYVTVRTEEGYRHKKGGVFYTTEMVWEEYCKQ